MAFDKIRAIIMDQLNVEESMVTMDTNMMKDLEADSLDAVENRSNYDTRQMMAGLFFVEKRKVR